MSDQTSQPLNATCPGQRATYAVGGGNHVTLLLDRSHTAPAFDGIEVVAQPGGGPPPHRHAFAEWFRILEAS
jgi:hypothetical protein